jgi:hypothetical protein
MNHFNELWRGRRGSRPKGTGGKAPRFLPELQPLDSRVVPSRRAVLDFDGEFLTAAQLGQGGWGGLGATSVPSFHSLLAATRPTLDAGAVIDRVVAKVREDYAAYDLDIIVGDQDVYQPMLTDAQVGDVLVLVTGGLDVRPGQSALGVSPWSDLGNENDEIVWCFGAEHSAGWTDDMFVNEVATTISHEMGHTFGLGHLTNPAENPGAIRHHIMTSVAPAGRNYNFQDLTYTTDVFAYDYRLSSRHPEFNTRVQNSHRHLSHPDVLGPSPKPWAAVLTPGSLTIMGSAGGDDARVVPDHRWGPGDWGVTVKDVGTGAQVQSATVDPSAFPDINSLNPFGTPVGTIYFHGGAEGDILQVSSAITAQVRAYGGEGSDYLVGGNGGDWLYGHGGLDTLIGQGGGDVLYGGDDRDVLYGGPGDDGLFGGAGHDDLYGHSGIDWLDGQAGDDRLYGGSENDWLVGGVGSDTLRGEAGNDRLDGTFDGSRDFLIDTDGVNTLVQHYYIAWVPGTGWVTVYEDSLTSDTDNVVEFVFHGVR